MRRSCSIWMLLRTYLVSTTLWLVQCIDFQDEQFVQSDHPYRPLQHNDIDVFDHRPKPQEFFDLDHHTSFAYMMEQTIALVTYLEPHGRMISCELFDIGTRKDRDDILNYLAMPATTVDLHDMVFIVDSCRHVKASTRNARSRIKASSGQYFNIFNGIMPGTKWCGHDNVAKHYEDLGSNVEVDKCCRAHDYCPLKVQPLTSRYGLFNFGFYTKSHCMCDSMFYKCLKEANIESSLATIVGNIFFNIINVKCLADKIEKRRRRPICLKYMVLDTGVTVCEFWDLDVPQDKKSLKVFTPSVTY